MKNQEIVKTSISQRGKIPFTQVMKCSGYMVREVVPFCLSSLTLEGDTTCPGITTVCARVTELVRQTVIESRFACTNS